MLTLAAAATAAWCAVLALAGPGSSPALVVQGLRDMAMLGWLGATFWSSAAPMTRPLRLILRMLATICALTLVLGAVAHLGDRTAAEAWMTPALTLAAMIVAVGGLLVVDSGVRHAGAALRMPVMAVAGGFAMLWAYEVNVQLIGALTGKTASTLIALLPAVVLLTLPTYVVAAMDIGRERMRLSRTAAMRTLILLGAAAYLIVIGLTGAIAVDRGRLCGAGTGASLAAALGTGGVLIASRARVAVGDDLEAFFEHRYDYRAEWMRFTATLAQGSDSEDGDGRNLHRRVAKAWPNDRQPRRG